MADEPKTETPQPPAPTVTALPGENGIQPPEPMGARPQGPTITMPIVELAEALTTAYVDGFNSAAAGVTLISRKFNREQHKQATIVRIAKAVGAIKEPVKEAPPEGQPATDAPAEANAEAKPPQQE